MRRRVLCRCRRHIAATIGLATLVVLLAHPLAGAASDVWGNVGPSPQIGDGGIAGRYPLGNYALDQHFDAISASLTHVDASGVPPMIAYFLAQIVWLATSFLASLLITLFGFAFGLDLVNGSEATGGAGALGPVSRAIHSIYGGVLGRPWLVLAISVAGIWAMWKALVQRRYAETAGTLGLSLIYVVLALFFVVQPGKTIGSVSGWTNQMSGAFLSVSSRGDVTSARQAKRDTANQLFDLLIFKPWVVLEFGGLEHCVRTGTGSADSDPESVAVRPLSSDRARDTMLARRLRSGTQVTADGKVCVNDANKYAHRFLRHGPGSEDRDAEYEALDRGFVLDSLGALGGVDTGPYRLGPADRPATDAMEKGGQYQRLLLALVVFVGELGAFCLLGALSIGVILAQVLLLLLLAFSPVALIAAVIPGRGHDFFKGWLEKLAGYLLRKAAYSLILAILLAVNGALATATAQLGWLMSFGLQSLFFWAVFLQRKSLAESLVGIATGPRAPGRDASLKLLSLYAGGRMAGHATRSVGRGARTVARAPGRVLGKVRGGGSGAAVSRRAPRFGTHYSAPVGGAAPSMDAPGPVERRLATPSGELGKRDSSATPTPDASGKPSASGSAAARRAGKRKREAGGRAETGPGRPRSGGKPPRPSAQREGGQPGDRQLQLPVEATSSPAEGEESLAAELRAEREQTREGLGKRSDGEERLDRGRKAPAPRRWRRRRRRKGGER